jgi:acid phosphatase
VSCGSGAAPSQSSSQSPGFTPIPGSSAQQVNHIYLVVLENSSYSDVVGAAYMPYWNSLTVQSALATNYFANIHQSLGDYFVMTTGQLITEDDNFAGTVTEDNIVRELSGIGKSARVYAEDLPSVGYTGPDVYPYIKHHDPFAYMSDVIASPDTYLRPFSEFASDLAQGTTADFNLIVPNNIDNAHDCPNQDNSCAISERLATADAWLQTNISPLLQRADFQANGLLIIAFDEGDDADTANVGGQVAVLLVGSAVKPGFRSTTFYQHQSLYRLFSELFGFNAGPAAGAPDMTEMLQ